MPEKRPGARLYRLVDQRLVAIAVAAVLVLFLVHNVYWLVRNQTERPCNQRVCRSPRSLEAVTRLSPNPKVVALATFYFLNRRIPNSRLAIPPWLARQQWNLEHLSRLRVEVSDQPFLVDPRHTEQLRRASTASRPFRRSPRGAARDLILLVDQKAGDYVFAETAQATGPVFVMPRSRYAEVAAGGAGP